MSVKNYVNGIRLVPVSADPSSPREGQLQVSDGTHRDAGVWQYINGAWNVVGGVNAKESASRLIGDATISGADIAINPYNSVTELLNTVPNTLVDTVETNNDTAIQRIAQTITTGSTDVYLDSIGMYFQSSSPRPRMLINIYEDNLGVPGTLIATSATSDTPLSQTVGSRVEFIFNNEILSSNSTYWIILDEGSLNTGTTADIYYNSANTYAGGNAFSITSAGVWQDLSYDLVMEILVTNQINTPLHRWLDVGERISDQGTSADINTTGSRAQTFNNVLASTLDRVVLVLNNKVNALAQLTTDPATTAIMDLYKDDGTGQPDTTTLISSQTIDYINIPPGINRKEILFNNLPLDANTVYWFVFRPGNIPAGMSSLRLMSSGVSDLPAGGSGYIYDENVNGGEYVSLTGNRGTIMDIHTNTGPISSGISITTSNDVYIQTEGLLDDRNTIAAQTMSFNNDGDVAYVIKNTTDVMTVLPVTIGPIESLQPDPNRVIIARRVGNKVVVGIKRSIWLADGESIALNSNS